MTIEERISLFPQIKGFSKTLYILYYIFGVTNKSPFYIPKNLRIILFFGLFILSKYSLGWFLYIAYYVFLIKRIVPESNKNKDLMDTMKQINIKLVEDKWYNERRYIKIYCYSFTLITLSGLLLVPWIYRKTLKLPSDPTWSDLTPIIFNCLGWTALWMIYSLTMALHYLTCHFHRLQQDIVLMIVKKREVRENKWEPLPGTPPSFEMWRFWGAINKKYSGYETTAEIKENPTIDAILGVYFNLRDSVELSSSNWVLYVLVHAFGLLSYWAMEMYPVLTHCKEVDWLKATILPVVAVMHFIPIAAINLASDYFLIGITDWRHYRPEERNFLFTYFTLHPVRYPILGFVISKSLFSSMAMAVIYSSISYLFTYQE